MVDFLALSNPPPTEAPKPSAGSPKTQKVGTSSFSTSAVAYAREDLEIRYQSKDGDILEVRRSVTLVAGYSRTSAGRGDAAGREDAALMPEFPCLQGGECCEEPGKGKDGLAKALKWAREVARQIEEQQARLLETLLKGGEEGKESQNGRFVMFDLKVVSGRMGPDGEIEVMDGEYGVPDYWNAENTSDRIVSFATSFAGIFGDDPGFVDTMLNAVADGFAQAGEILGGLPGKAGKLNRDTHDMVFEKLDKWVEAWKAGAYNGEAQTKAMNPALAA